MSSGTLSRKESSIKVLRIYKSFDFIKLLKRKTCIMYIFASSELSKDEMTKITDPQICGELPSSKIYLSWSEMAWKFVGEITVYNVTRGEVCPASDYSVTINFPSKLKFRHL